MISRPTIQQGIVLDIRSWQASRRDSAQHFGVGMISGQLIWCFEVHMLSMCMHVADVAV